MSPGGALGAPAPCDPDRRLAPLRCGVVHNACVRRMAPWALLGLVVVAGGLAASVGAAQSPAPSASSVDPVRWVSGVLRATEQAGSARFSYGSDVQSANALLRSSQRGVGVVDFVRGDAQVTEATRSIEFGSSTPSGASQSGPGLLQPRPTTTTVEAIDVGGVRYERFDQLPISLGFTKLAGSPLPPGRSRLLALPLSAASAIDELLAPRQVVSVHVLGPGRIGGAEVTGYEVRTALPPSCSAVSRRAQPSPSLSVAPTLLWVDGAGRLVRIRSSVHEDIPAAAGAGAVSGGAGMLTGTTATIETLTFSRFGDPVRIAPPNRVHTLGHSFSVGLAVAKGCAPKDPVNP